MDPAKLRTKYLFIPIAGKYLFMPGPQGSGCSASVLEEGLGMAYRTKR